MEEELKIKDDLKKEDIIRHILRLHQHQGLCHIRNNNFDQSDLRNV